MAVENFFIIVFNVVVVVVVVVCVGDCIPTSAFFNSPHLIPELPTVQVHMYIVIPCVLSHVILHIFPMCSVILWLYVIRDGGTEEKSGTFIPPIETSRNFENGNQKRLSPTLEFSVAQLL